MGRRPLPIEIFRGKANPAVMAVAAGREAEPGSLEQNFIDRQSSSVFNPTGHERTLAKVTGPPHGVDFDKALHVGVVVLPFGLVDHRGMRTADYFLIPMKMVPDLIQGACGMIVAPLQIKSRPGCVDDAIFLDADELIAYQGDEAPWIVLGIDDILHPLPLIVREILGMLANRREF